jgi:hypothetical protein
VLKRRDSVRGGGSGALRPFASKYEALILLASIGIPLDDMKTEELKELYEVEDAAPK